MDAVGCFQAGKVIWSELFYLSSLLIPVKDIELLNKYPHLKNPVVHSLRMRMNRLLQKGSDAKPPS